ncbi:MAG: energy transducer TonB [Pseudomonadota bacterium]|nr:energy transducer TonB [Pseudomonadota bacterium]
MSYAELFSNQDNNNDLGITLIGAALLHIVLILGLTFSLPDKHARDTPPQLEITLVQAHTKDEPDKADFLANASQQGGGDSDLPLRATSPLPGTSTSKQSQPVFRPASTAAEDIKSQTDKVLVAETKKQKTLTQPLKNKKMKTREQKPLIGLPQQMNLTNERDRLLAEISLQQQNYQKRPRKKFLTARTREYKYASYMDAWRAKVERIGNLNYPEEAKRRNLAGSLILDVAILPDGRLDSINVRRSSRHKALDDAAIRIVRLAAPYSPFPKNFRDDVDIIHITRTWKFQHGDRLTSQ